MRAVNHSVALESRRGQSSRQYPRIWGRGTAYPLEAPLLGSLGIADIRSPSALSYAKPSHAWNICSPTQPTLGAKQLASVFKWLLLWYTGKSLETVTIRADLGRQ